MEKENERERSKRHFDSIATSYNISHEGKFCADMYTPLIRAIHKSKGETLLDLGCGNGNLLTRLMRCGFALTGADLSEAMIERARQRLDGYAELIVADAGYLPFPADAFDVLVCNASFHHYPDPEAALKEMHRVLRPGGTLLIGECYMPQPLRAAMNVLKRFSPDGDHHFYGRRELSSLLEVHGFAIQSIRKTGKHTVLYQAKGKERFDCGGN